MEDALKNLEPHKNMYELNGYRQLSNVASFPKPVALTVANWHRRKDTHPDEQSEAFLDTLCV